MVAGNVKDSRCRTIRTFLIISVLIASVLSCGNTADVKSETVKIDYGEASFISELEMLDNPKGILPTTSSLGSGYPGIIKKTPNRFFEYFVYDNNVVLAVLSISPLYYVKISSPDVAIRFNAEYNQFLSNIYLNPESKAENGPFEFIKAGRNEIAIAFTPSELSFSSEDGVSEDGHNMILNNSSDFQIQKSLYDSEWACLYVPFFEEREIFTELSLQRSKGQKKIVYANKSDFFPRIDAVSPATLNFPFIYMKSGRTSGDYFVLFSNSLGDSGKISDKPDESKNYLSCAHGFAIVIRADTNTSILPFLNAKGFDFTIVPEVAKDLNLEKVDDNQILVSWTPESEVKIQRQVVTDPDGFRETGWVNIGTVSGASYQDTSVQPGYLYYYRLCSTSNGKEIVRKNIVVPINPGAGDIVFTELVFVGSLQADSSSKTGSVKRTSDRWFEVKNISGKIVKLDNVSAYYNGSLIFGPDGSGNTASISRYIYPGKYFVVANIKDYIFSEMVIADISVRKIPEIECYNLDNVLSMNVDIDGVVIPMTSKITMEGNIGSNTTKDGKSCFQSKVLLKTGEWANSQIDFANINPLSSYIHKNLCTPGRSAYDNTEY